MRRIYYYDGPSRPLVDDVELIERIKERVSKGKPVNLTLDEKRRLFVVYHSLSTIYFVAAVDAGMIKIGVTQSLKKRLKTLTNMSPIPLKVALLLHYDESLEKRIHEHLKEYRSHGEWFHADKPVIDFMWGAKNKGIRWVIETVGESPGHWMNTLLNKPMKGAIPWLGIDQSALQH